MDYRFSQLNVVLTRWVKNARSAIDFWLFEVGAVQEAALLQELGLKVAARLFSGSGWAKYMDASKREDVVVILRVILIVRWREVQVLHPKLCLTFVCHNEEGNWDYLTVSIEALGPIQSSELKESAISSWNRNLVVVKKLEVCSDNFASNDLSFHFLSARVFWNECFLNFWFLHASHLDVVPYFEWLLFFSIALL